MSRKGVLPQLLGLALVMLLVAGCGGESAQPSAATATPSVSVGKIKGALASSGGSDVGGRKLGLWSTSCDVTGGWQKMESTGLETTSDESGAFLFEDVAPGCYTIMVTISGQGIPLKAGEGVALVEVVEGQTKDMGSIPLIIQ